MTLIAQTTFNGTSGSHFLLKIYYELLSQSVENNTSTVKYTATIQSKDGYSGSGTALQYTINSVGGSSGVTSVPVNSEVTLGTKTETLTHDENGNLSPLVDATCNSFWTGLGNAAINDATYSLPQIIRGIIRIKVAGVWKTGRVYTKVAGVWKQAIGVHTKVSGTWKRSV